MRLHDISQEENSRERYFSDNTFFWVHAARMCTLCTPEAWGIIRIHERCASLFFDVQETYYCECPRCRRRSSFDHYTTEDNIYFNEDMTICFMCEDNDCPVPPRGVY